MHRRVSIRLLMLLVLMLAACMPTNPFTTMRVPGVIDFFGEPTNDVVDAPAEVRVNTPFDVTIATFGDGCTSTGDATVTVTGNVATITVTDVRQRANACDQPLLRFSRRVTVQFATPGAASIRVTGQRVGPETGGMTEGTATTLERQLVVR